MARIRELDDAGADKAAEIAFRHHGRMGRALGPVTLFLRVYRSLDAIVGGDDASAAAWLRNDNTALGQPPVEAMKSVAGLVDTLAYLPGLSAWPICLAYLDARRAVV